MHHIYHTEGIILGSKNLGEAGKYFYVFTRDLGMIYASAEGVRKMSSKLRYILQDYSYVKIDLIRTRNFWKITSASKTNKLEGITKNNETSRISVNVSLLLRRLLSGEEKNAELFDDLIRGFAVLEDSKSREELYNIETILVLRILYHLGYIGGDEKYQNLVKSPFEDSLVFEVSKTRSKILYEINKVLRETHL